MENRKISSVATIAATRRLYPFVRILFTLLSVIALGYGQQKSGSESWRLGKVSVTGLQRYSESQIIAISGLRVGETVDIDRIEAATDRLLNSGLFKRLNYRYRAQNGEIEVTFVTEEIKWSIPVTFDNFIWFSDQEIIAAVAKDVPGFDGTGPESGKALDTISKT